jgi:protocatechuate 3,4-dioxygenase beta subunit
MLKKVSIILSILAMSAFTVKAGTVSGTVTDTGTAATPIQNAIITLTPAGGGGGTPLHDTTDATGGYAIANAAAGFYTIVAEAVGYTASTPAFVNVGAANTITRDIVLTPLPKGIIISGTVTDSVTGNPLPGAIVRLRTGAGGGGAGVLVDSAIAGANGQYSIDSVQPATYRLVASAGGHTAKTITGLVVAAANLTRDFQLVGLPVGIIISGTVTDSVSGNSLVGGTVTLLTGGGIGGGTVVATATVTAQGYSIDSVQPGTYTLTATAAGHTAKTVNGVAVAAAAVTRNFQLVGLPAGIMISGTVTDSVKGTSLAGAIVRLRTGGGGGGGTLVDSAIVAANGTYSIDSVQPGTYSLTATAVGHTAKTDAGIVVAAANLTRNFELLALPGIDITGRVADSTTGAPLGGAVVRLMQGTVLVDSAIVAANGSYTLTSVPAGTYSLSATATGHAVKTMTGLVVANASLTENFFLVVGTGVVAISPNTKSLMPEISMTAGLVHLRNVNGAGTVSLYGINGKLLYSAAIAPHASSVAIPNGIARAGGVYLVSLTQNSSVYRKQVVLP